MHLLILGPAGSGKTLLTFRLGKYLSQDYEVRYVNLDPGVDEIPYIPDFDVRSEYTLGQIMRSEGLGPNGAMLRAIDRLGDLDLPPIFGDFVLLDTPGQLEPFVFRNAGPTIVGRLPECTGIYIVDATSPMHTLPSLLLYSLAAQFSLGAPVVNVINKVDLLSDRQRNRLCRFLTNPEDFLDTEAKEKGLRWEINMRMAKMMKEFLPAQRPCPISAKTGGGMDQLLELLREIRCACGDLT